MPGGTIDKLIGGQAAAQVQAARALQQQEAMPGALTGPGMADARSVIADLMGGQVGAEQLLQLLALLSGLGPGLEGAPVPPEGAPQAGAPGEEEISPAILAALGGGGAPAGGPLPI